MGKGKRVRAARLTKQQRPVRQQQENPLDLLPGGRRALAALVGQVLPAVADYRPSADGGWDATLQVEGLSPVEFHTADAHEALHEVLDRLEELTEWTDIGFGTVHTLDGSPEAWALLAAREGFMGCAQGEHTTPMLLTGEA